MQRFMAISGLAILLVAGLIAGCAGKAEEQKVETVELPNVIVCSMDSTGQVEDSSYKVYEYNGKKYVFSSEACRQIVASDPDKYLGVK